MSRPEFSRILLKLSGETFGGSKGIGFDHEVVAPVVPDVFVTKNPNGGEQAIL